MAATRAVRSPVSGEISTPSDHPLILLFTGGTGEQYEYRSAWLPGGTFRYTGEGQAVAMMVTLVRCLAGGHQERSP